MSRTMAKQLNQDDFFKLLATQMSSQDPLNPQTDTNFIAQMAQFSSLEQSRTMQSDIAVLRGQQELAHAYSLIGRSVEISTGPESSITGVVSGVESANGTTSLLMNGEKHQLNAVTRVWSGK